MNEVDIVNSALTRLGAEPITALFPPDNSKRAELANARYHYARRAVARLHAWKCLQKRVTLAPLVDAPAHTFTHQMLLPADCLRVLIRADLEDLLDDEYTIEGNRILSNRDSLKIVYIADLTDTSQYDYGFAEALALKLAVDLCYPLKQDDAMAAIVTQEFERTLRMAKAIDATQEGRRQIDSDEFIDAQLGVSSSPSTFY